MPAEFSGLCMWKKAERQSADKKANSAVAAGVRRKLARKERKASHFSKNITVEDV